MSSRLIINIFMSGAAFCYAGAAFGYYFQGKPWMSFTFFLYMVTIFTLYMEGIE